MNPQQCQAARALLGWKCEDIETAAKKAKTELGVATVWRFEAGDSVRQSSIDKIKETLENAGVEFIAEKTASRTGGPGVRLKK